MRFTIKSSDIRHVSGIQVEICSYIPMHVLWAADKAKMPISKDLNCTIIFSLVSTTIHVASLVTIKPRTQNILRSEHLG